MRSAIGLVSSPVETDRVYRLRYGITLLDLGSPDRTTLRYWFSSLSYAYWRTALYTLRSLNPHRWTNLRSE